MKTSTKETMRPLAERITQGPITRDGAVLLIKHSRTGMLFFKAYVGTPENAELITEAFTVCQETGKTPRQLADEVSDLREQVKEHDACADAWCAKAKALNQERAELIAALSRAVLAYRDDSCSARVGERIIQAEELLARLQP